MNSIDWTAVATFVLALFTGALAWQVRGQTATTRRADRDRQREAHILAVRPLLLGEPVITTRIPGLPIAQVVSEVIGDLPVLDLTITLRGGAQDGTPASYSGPPHSLAPGGRAITSLELQAFLNLQTNQAWNVGAFEVVATYHGLLGQWVVEHYEWDYEARRRQPTASIPTWRLYRLEIEPRGVPGASSIDLRFGAPPGYV